VLTLSRKVDECKPLMLGMSGLSVLAVFFMSSAGSVIFSAFGVALLCIGAHSAVRAGA
jgi:hypothetical protein